MESGYIYVLINSSMEGMVKIGKTTRDPETRVNELSRATGVPTPFILVYKEYFPDCSSAETIIHEILEDSGYRLSSNREFFNIPSPDAINLIQKVKQSLSAEEYNNSNSNTITDNDENIEQMIESLIEEGEACLHGHGDTLQNFNRAFNHLKKAGKLGSAEAYFIIGEAYLDSTLEECGLKLSIAKALEYFERGSSLKGFYGNRCMAEMAMIFSGSYWFITDEDFQHLNNAKTCWKKFFKGLNLKGACGMDFLNYNYLNKYILSFLPKVWNFTDMRDESIRDSLEPINWFKYKVKDSLDNYITRFPDGYESQYYEFAKSFLRENFDLSDSYRDFELNISSTWLTLNNEWLQSDNPNIKINAEVLNGTLFVDDIVGFSLREYPDYEILKMNIKKLSIDNEEVLQASKGQKITITVNKDDILENYGYSEFLELVFVMKKEKNLEVTKLGTFTYKKPLLEKRITQKETTPEPENKGFFKTLFGL